MPPFPPYHRRFDREVGHSVYIRNRAYQRFQREELNPFFRFTARDTTTETVEIVEPALSVAKSGDVAVNPGDTVSYSVAVTNTGTAPA